MTKKVTREEQLMYDIGCAYEQLDQVFSITQLLRNYVENKETDELNKWTVKKALEGILSLVIEIQCSLESSVEKDI